MDIQFTSKIIELHDKSRIKFIFIFYSLIALLYSLSLIPFFRAETQLYLKGLGEGPLGEQLNNSELPPTLENMLPIIQSTSSVLFFVLGLLVSTLILFIILKFLGQVALRFTDVLKITLLSQLPMILKIVIISVVNVFREPVPYLFPIEQNFFGFIDIFLILSFYILFILVNKQTTLTKMQSILVVLLMMIYQIISSIG